MIDGVHQPDDNRHRLRLDRQCRAIVQMWRVGFDTAAIAAFVRTPEPLVDSWLRGFREKARVAMTAKPAKCSARQNDDLMICERCGLEWVAGMQALPCRPITFDVLARRMSDEVSYAETSLSVVSELHKEGAPADPAPARRRLAELKAVMRLVDRCAIDRGIQDRLNGKT